MPTTRLQKNANAAAASAEDAGSKMSGVKCTQKRPRATRRRLHYESGATSTLVATNGILHGVGYTRQSAGVVARTKRRSVPSSTTTQGGIHKRVQTRRVHVCNNVPVQVKKEVVQPEGTGKCMLEENVVKVEGNAVVEHVAEEGVDDDEVDCEEVEPMVEREDAVSSKGEEEENVYEEPMELILGDCLVEGPRGNAEVAVMDSHPDEAKPLKEGRKRGAGRPYGKPVYHKSEEEMKQYRLTLGDLKQGNHVVRKRHQYIEYRCIHQKTGCPFFVRQDVTEAGAFYTRTAFEHEHSIKKWVGIHPQHREILKEHIAVGTTSAKTLHDALQCNNNVDVSIPLPSATQINNFVANNKGLIEKGRRNTYAGLHDICELYAFEKVKVSEGFSDTSIFVVPYEYQGGPIVENMITKLPHIDADKDEMLVVLTCKAFLSNLPNAQLLPYGGQCTIDCKNKVNWNGYPVCPFGVLDADQHFFFIGLGILSHEKAEFFQPLMASVFQMARKLITGYDGKIAFGMSDNDDAFGNAAMAYRSQTTWTWLNCYMHLVVCNVTKCGATLNTKLHNDPHMVQLAKDMLLELRNIPQRQVFNRMISLFINFWVYHNHQFIYNFINEYYPEGERIYNTVVQRDDRQFGNHFPIPNLCKAEYKWKGNWCRSAAAAGVNLTQCAIEGKNKDVGFRTTFHRRQVVTDYMVNAIKYLSSEGKRMKNAFTFVPTVTNDIWRNAQKIVHTFQIRGALRYSGGNIWLVPTARVYKKAVDELELAYKVNKDNGNKIPIFQQSLQPLATQYLKAISDPNGTLQEINDGFRILSSFYVLQPLHTDIGPYIKFSCTCPVYQAKLKCKHSIARAIVMRAIEVPMDKRLDMIGRRKRPGAPRKHKAARAYWTRISSDEGEEDALDPEDPQGFTDDEEE